MNKRRRWIAKHRRRWLKLVKPYMCERWLVVGDQTVPIRFTTAARNEKEAQKYANGCSEAAMVMLGHDPPYTWRRDAMVLYCMEV